MFLGWVVTFFFFFPTFWIGMKQERLRVHFLRQQSSLQAMYSEDGIWERT